MEYISPQFVLSVTGELQEQIRRTEHRPLERIYQILFMDGLSVGIRSDKGVLKKYAYMFFVVHGQRIVVILARLRKGCSPNRKMRPLPATQNW